MTPTTGEWIAVEDRLPEPSRYVIVFFRSDTDWHTETDTHNGIEWRREGEFGRRITHWMPLPAPPGGDR